MRRTNDDRGNRRQIAKPTQPVKRPATKEEALKMEIGRDPEKAAQLIREILKNK